MRESTALLGVLQQHFDWHKARLSYLAAFVVALVSQKSGLVVTIDRTNWHFGHAPINVLVLGVAWAGGSGHMAAFAKSGVSSTRERIALVRRFLRLVEAGAPPLREQRGIVSPFW